MAEQIEILQAVSTIAGSISTITVLIWWVILERKRTDALLHILTEDWKRQREEEIERRAEERFQKKLNTIPAGGGGI
jgi:PAS domain-containing protein